MHTISSSWTTKLRVCQSLLSIFQTHISMTLSCYYILLSNFHKERIAQELFQTTEVYVFSFVTVEFAVGKQGHSKTEKVYQNTAIYQAQ